MKKFFFSLFVMVLSLGSIAAQSDDAMHTITKVVNASADDVWEVLRDLDNIGEHSSIIATVDFTGDMHGVGGKRVCTTADGQGKFVESIVDYSDDQRTYTYAVVEGVPAKGMVNTFKVVDLGYRKSMIVWQTNFEQFIKNPQMTKDQFLGFLDQSANEFINSMAATAMK